MFLPNLNSRYKKDGYRTVLQILSGEEVIASGPAPVRADEFVAAAATFMAMSQGPKLYLLAEKFKPVLEDLVNAGLSKHTPLLQELEQALTDCERSLKVHKV
jgi:hypothetical protein